MEILLEVKFKYQGRRLKNISAISNCLEARLCSARDCNVITMNNRLKLQSAQVFQTCITQTALIQVLSRECQ